MKINFNIVLLVIAFTFIFNFYECPDEYKFKYMLLLVITFTFIFNIYVCIYKSKSLSPDHAEKYMHSVTVELLLKSLINAF